MPPTLTRRIVLLAIAAFAPLAGCAVAPHEFDRPSFQQSAHASTAWFRRAIDGLPNQIAASGGYVVFPDLIQWGMLFSGGTYGRGAVCSPDGSQVGWAALSTGSLGLQAGLQGFRMLVIFENDGVMKKFQSNQLLCSVNGVAIVAENGGSGRMPFHNGVAVYEGANEGLMAGINIGLNLLRYEALTAAPGKPRPASRPAPAPSASRIIEPRAAPKSATRQSASRG